jgi:hypothetical protein
VATVTFNLKQPGGTIVVSGYISEEDLAEFAPQLANLLTTLSTDSTPASG